MKSTIWKAVLRVADTQEIETPAGAQFLCAREQFEQICVWFRCDPDNPVVKRSIAIVGTGHPAPSNDGIYIGTVSLLGGQLIFHVFEVMP